jgi:hypothetical protein
MGFAELRTALEAGPARRQAQDADVWIVSRPSWWDGLRGAGATESTKRQILRAIWDVPQPLFFLCEEPGDPDLAPFLHQELGAWRIDAQSDPDRFYAAYPVSALGNWQLYGAPAPVDGKWPDSFREEPSAIIRFMQTHRMTLLVDSFHDDTDWCVALCHDPSAEAAA